MYKFTWPIEDAAKIRVHICTIKVLPTIPDSVPKTQHALSATRVFLDHPAVQIMAVAFLCSVDATYHYFCVWKSRIIYLTIKKLLDIIVL